MKSALVALVVVAGLSLAPAAHARRTCQEVSDIVGRQKCTRYGWRWAIEDTLPITFGVGARYVAFSPVGHIFSGTLDKKLTLARFQYDGSALGESPIRSGGIGFRITGFVLPGLYAGLDYGIELGRNERAAFSAGGASFRSTQKVVDTSTFGGGAIVGLRLPLGRLSLRGELFLGGYAINLYQAVVRGAFENDSVAVGAGTWAVEPRAAVDLWATPWLTVSGTYGRNLVDHGSQAASLLLTWHGRSFDGSYFF